MSKHIKTREDPKSQREDRIRVRRLYDVPTEVDRAMGK